MFEANSQNELLSPSQNPLEPPLQSSRSHLRSNLVNYVKCEHLTRRVNTGMEVPGKPAPHLVYFF